MYQLQIQVHVLKANRALKPGVISKRFHAFVLSVIQQVDPVFSNFLHQRKERQLFSFLLGQHLISIRTSSLELVSRLQQGFLALTEIDLHDWIGRVQEIHYHHVDEHEVMRRFSNNVRMNFITPTTFYQSGNYYPLPELHRVLNSANKVYEMSGYNAISSEQINTFAREIKIEQVTLETHRVRFGDFTVVGFCGKMDLSFHSLSYVEQQEAWRLLSYGAFMGIGYKTAWGLGQTHLKPLRNLRQSTASANT
jgi:CRISPR-associated endoribonuclease Cas6